MASLIQESNLMSQVTQNEENMQQCSTNRIWYSV